MVTQFPLATPQKRHLVAKTLIEQLPRGFNAHGMVLFAVLGVLLVQAEAQLQVPLVPHVELMPIAKQRHLAVALVMALIKEHA